MVSRKLGKGTMLEIETCSYVRTSIHLGRYPSHSLIVISLTENWELTFALFFEIFISSLTWDTVPPARSVLLLLAACNPGVTAVWRKPIQFGEYRICLPIDSAAESLRACCFYKSESPLFMLSAALILQYFPNAFLYQSSASPLLEEIPAWERRSPAAVCECLLASCH